MHQLGQIGCQFGSEKESRFLLFTKETPKSRTWKVESKWVGKLVYLYRYQTKYNLRLKVFVKENKSVYIMIIGTIC